MRLRADVAAAFQEAVVEVLVAKSRAAIARTGLDRLVVAGGVGANMRLRTLLDDAGSRDGFSVFYPALQFCTDNGAMIALAGAMRLQARPSLGTSYRFAIHPRWISRPSRWRGALALFRFRSFHVLFPDLALLAGGKIDDVALVTP